MTHPPAVCVRDVRSSQYVGRGWRSIFRCPAPDCKRQSWFALNFLSGRKVVCDGRVFKTEKKVPA